FEHVEEERGVLRVEQTCRPGGVDLADLGLDLLEKLSVARHWFQKYSEERAPEDRAPVWSDGDPARPRLRRRRARRSRRGGCDGGSDVPDHARRAPFGAAHDDATSARRAAA